MFVNVSDPVKDTKSSSVNAVLNCASVPVIVLLPSVNVLFVTVLVLLVDNISAPPNVAVVASIFATSVPNVTERLPVEAPVNEPVPNVNLSSD